MGLFNFNRLRSLGGGGPPIAIDFGSQTLKALQLTSGEPFALTAAASLGVPDALGADSLKRLAWQVEALPKLLKSAPFRAKRAICSIPGAQLFCKHMQLPLGDPDTAGEIVAGAVAGQLRCDPGALMVRHVVVDGAQSAPPGKSEVIAMAATRGLITKLMGALKAAKIEPIAIVPEPLALVRSFDHITRRAGDAELTSLYLDLGAGTTKVIVAHGTALVFAKTIQLGGRALDQAVARQKNCSVGEARAVRLGVSTFGRSAAPTAAPAFVSATREAADAEIAEGVAMQRSSLAAIASEEDRRRGQSPPGTLGNVRPTDPAPSADLSDAVDSLTDEVAMCLRYYEAMFPQRRVGRTIFVGGEARHAGLCQHVARKLRLPAHVADPMLRIKRPPAGENVTNGVDFSQPQPGWAVALGLCLSHVES